MRREILPWTLAAGVLIAGGCATERNAPKNPDPGIAGNPVPAAAPAGSSGSGIPSTAAHAGVYGTSRPGGSSESPAPPVGAAPPAQSSSGL